MSRVVKFGTVWEEGGEIIPCENGVTKGSGLLLITTTFAPGVNLCTGFDVRGSDHSYRWNHPAVGNARSFPFDSGTLLTSVFPRPGTRHQSD